MSPHACCFPELTGNRDIASLWLVALCLKVLDLTNDAFAIQDFTEDDMLAI